MSLTPGQRAFLEEKHFAVLGTVNASGSPHLTIMWYLLDGDEIVFNTKAGRTKESNLARDPRVSLLVYDDGGYKYIRIDGRVTEIAVADEVAAAAELVMGKLDRCPVAIVRGIALADPSESARDYVRPAEKDMFR